MPVSAAEIATLREAYRAARAEIDAFVDPVERAIGLATLRLEATNMLRQLITTVPGLSDADVAPLKEYVANPFGGEWAERTLAALDAEAEKRAKQAVGGVVNMVVPGVAGGGFVTVVGVVAQLALTAQNIGAWLFAFLIGGGPALYIAVRALQIGSGVAVPAWVRSWEWASSLGAPADRALTAARTLQNQIALAASGRVWSLPQPVSAKARTYAQLGVGAMWALVGIGAALIGWGFIEAVDE